MRTATLTNLDRAEYGTITVNLDLLDKQITWLSCQFKTEMREGLLNLLGGIMDLTDPPEDNEENI